MDVIFNHPANQKLLRVLEKEQGLWKSKDPHLVDLFQLGTHPELIEYLWHDLADKLPVNCQWVIYSRPVLVRFDSGIIFGCAGGTHTYGFRLSPDALEEALKVGAKRITHYPEYANLGIPASSFDIETFGPEWILGGFFKQEQGWCLSAFNFAVDPSQE